MAKSPLYDNERSQSDEDKSDERAGEDRMEDRKKKDSADERAGEKKAEDRKETDSADERAGEEKMETAKKASDKFLDAMKALHKQHEMERRDHHGNHREALRQMAARHEKSFRDLVDGFEGDDEEGEEVTGTEAAAAADDAMEA